MTLLVSSPEQERQFSEAIARICSLLKDNEVIDVLPRTLYLHKDRTWSWRFESTGASVGAASLEQIMIEFACHKMDGFNMNIMRIKDQETFDELFVELMIRMSETEREITPASS